VVTPADGAFTRRTASVQGTVTCRKPREEAYCRSLQTNAAAAGLIVDACQASTFDPQLSLRHFALGEARSLKKAIWRKINWSHAKAARTAIGTSCEHGLRELHDRTWLDFAAAGRRQVNTVMQRGDRLNLPRKDQYIQRLKMKGGRGRAAHRRPPKAR
jgi:hypothetical protein